MVDAAEVAFVAVFLASEKASAVSGELVAASAERPLHDGPPAFDRLSHTADPTMLRRNNRQMAPAQDPTRVILSQRRETIR